MKILLIIIMNSYVAFAQAQQSAIRKHTDSICKAIDKDVELKKKIYAQEEFIEQVTDRGGELTVYNKKNTA